MSHLPEYDRWLSHEVERSIDLVNVVYGAFFSAFLGIKLVNVEPFSWNGFWVLMTLFNFVLFLNSTRILSRIWLGLAFKTWYSTGLAVVTGIIGTVAGIEKVLGLGGVAVAFIVFWMLSLSTCLAGYKIAEINND